ncbi:tyrosinase family protein [Acidovorax sp. SUPP2825]|uniref:tyrosinase family protein n=1 Tax=Acidovorax sp. SUPP2825 TaxID=2920879 RepID=UPI0023DE3446|nr:tyrosinase family protein [Acidovorax sp. SUPP2825]GKS95497.1 tyrosinase family protein [Acidovorax sp. SUPP2825]
MSHSHTSRRQALQHLASLTAGFSLWSLQHSAAWAQNPADNPQNCAPPPPPGPATPFQGGKIAVKPRKSAFALTDAEIASLTKGWQGLRDITAQNPNSPTGWLRQSYVHCWACGGGTDGQQGEEIHSSWWFPPWHRAYLFFLERALVKASGDPDLRLPYWDWSTQSPSTQTFPQIYASAGSALYDPLRNPANVKPGARIPAAFVGPKAMSIVLNSPTYALFGGVNTAIGGGSPGALETIPHNHVHVWTGTDGSQSPNYGSDMGVLSTAARDPVFFAHHSNVDRMWSSWVAVDPSHTNPPDADWNGHAWNFYDENGVWTSMKVSDVVNSENLGYVYDSLATPPKPLRSAVRTAGASQPAPAENAALAHPAQPLVVLAAPQKRNLGTAPVTHKAALPEGFRKPLAALAANQSSRLYLLHIDDVTTPPDRSVSAKVYVNLPNANASTTTESPNFVGMISSVAKTTPANTAGHAAHHQAGIRYSFVIDEETARLIARDKAVTVTLVPVDSNGATPRRSQLNYGRISLTPLP